MSFPSAVAPPSTDDAGGHSMTSNAALTQDGLEADSGMRLAMSMVRAGGSSQSSEDNRVANTPMFSEPPALEPTAAETVARSSNNDSE